jgi:hypothetical protein
MKQYFFLYIYYKIYACNKILYRILCVIFNYTNLSFFLNKKFIKLSILVIYELLLSRFLKIYYYEALGKNYKSCVKKCHDEKQQIEYNNIIIYHINIWSKSRFVKSKAKQYTYVCVCVVYAKLKS